MKALPVKFLMDKINLRSALIVSFALHVVLAALAPSLAWNRTTPLKEKSHNKVRITMLKNEAGKPRLERVNFNLESASMANKIQRVRREMPRIARVQAPVARPKPPVVDPPQSIAPSSRTPLRTQRPLMQVAQVDPKLKSIPETPDRSAGSFRSKKVEPQKVNHTNVTSPVMPIQRINQDIRDSETSSPAARINSRVGTEVKRSDFKLNSIVPIPSAGSVDPPSRSKLVSVRSHGPNAVQVASLVPREMTFLEYDEPPDETEIASEVLEKILNEFYAKVGRQISYAKIYPEFARERGYQGKTLVAFRINRDGKILSLSVNRSSGHEILDEAALESVKKAGPYPPIPGELKQSVLSFVIPISYALR